MEQRQILIASGVAAVVAIIIALIVWNVFISKADTDTQQQTSQTTTQQQTSQTNTQQQMSQTTTQQQTSQTTQQQTSQTTESKPIFSADSAYSRLTDNITDPLTLDDPSSSKWTDMNRNTAIYIIGQSALSPFAVNDTCKKAVIRVLQGLKNSQIFPILTATDISTIKSESHIAPLIGADQPCPI